MLLNILDYLSKLILLSVLVLAFVLMAGYIGLDLLDEYIQANYIVIQKP